MTTFNRGQTPDELGSAVDRLHGDRSDPGQLMKALGGRDFDAVVDTIAMRPEETQGALDVLDARIGHYVHFSTGQVYLVREGCTSPAREAEYEGPLIPRPGSEWETREWQYGIDKRGCEDLLAEAWETRGFPVDPAAATDDPPRARSLRPDPRVRAASPGWRPDRRPRGVRPPTQAHRSARRRDRDRQDRRRWVGSQ